MEVFLHLPKTEKGKAELAEDLALFHAEHAVEILRKLPCPTEQKLKLLEAVVKDARQQAKARVHKNKSGSELFLCECQ
ncbi:MAG: hypothetical protein LUG49_07520 [Oscillospiraceae bacterium]|nr:hypothetical protein [Oscillospiraceae bacterium]